MKKWFPSILLTAILILAAFLRLYKIADYMTFLGDEGRDVLIVYNILHGHLTLLGPTSSVGGFFLGPIYYYFMAPFLLLFNYNPVGPAVMVALFGIFTVWFVYEIGSDFFNKTTGIIAAFLYTISPLVIAYARSSWNPNLMPPFTLLTLYTAYKGVKSKNTWLFLLCGFLLGILIQLHYLATFVGVIIFFYILINFLYQGFVDHIRKKVLFMDLIKKYVVVFVGFIIGLSPYIAFEARHGFPNTISIFKFIFHSQDVTSGGNAWMILEDVFFRLFGRLMTNFPPPEQVSLQAHTNIAIWYSLTLAMGILSCGYFLFVIYKGSRMRDQELRTKKIQQYSLIFLWFFVGIFMFGFYKKTIYDYYFEFLFPLPFLLVGSFLSFLFSKKIYLKMVAVGILVVLTYMNLQGIPFRSLPNRQLNQAEVISRFVLSKTNNMPYNFALITGGNSDQEYRYFFTIWGKPPTAILNPGDDQQRKSVTNQLLIVCESLPCHPLGDSLWEVAGFGRAEIAGHWDVSVVEVYKLVHFKENNPISK